MNPPEMTVEELKAALETGARLTIVDIREAEEYAFWHIPGSLNLPVYEALRSGETEAPAARLAQLPRERPVLTVCRLGIMSRRAADLLAARGFDVRSLRGGIRAWSAAWSVARLEWDGGVLLQVRRNGKGCLSYIVGREGQALVVDPALDPAVYEGLLAEHGLRLARVVETHVHADHVSRARALCAATGAALVLPRNQRVAYPHVAVAEGDRIEVGGRALRVVATPGHTGESVCYALDGFLFSGDTLFVDSVGRPDLERGDAGAPGAARELYRSLERLRREFGHCLLLPCHHGSPIDFDGVPIAAPMRDVAARLPLLGLDENAFVDTVLETLGPKPPNVETILALNEGRLAPGTLDPLDLEGGPNRCAVG